MKQSKEIRMIKALSLLSILLALSGMAAMVSANSFPSPPNMFYGDVTLNGADAPAGIVISAYINGELKGSLEITTAGKYGYDLNYLSVDGNDGDVITFMVCGVPANENITCCGGCGPRIRDLSAEDYEAPAVTDPDANPPSIVPENGVQLSRLNVTVTDNSAVGTVIVNLSAIGGHEAKVMEYFGGGLYSTTTSAANGTPSGTYHLWVNASDVVGNYNDSVYITLNVTSMTSDDWRYEWMGPESDGDPWTDVTTNELVIAATCWLNEWPTPMMGLTLTTENIQELVAAWLASGGTND